MEAKDTSLWLPGYVFACVMRVGEGARQYIVPMMQTALSFDTAREIRLANNLNQS